MRTPILVFLSVLLTANSFASIGDNAEKVGKKYFDTGEEIVAAFQDRSGESFANLLDMTTISERALDGMKYGHKDKLEIVRGMQQAKGQVGSVVVSLVSADSLMRVVRARHHADGVQVLVRANMGDLGFSYRDFLLYAKGDEAPKIIDWYDYSSGQNYSDSIRQSLIAILPGNSNYGRLLDLVRGKNESRKQFRDLLNATTNQDFNTFFSIYDKADDELKEHRLVLIMANGMASISNDEQRMIKTLGLIAEHYGDDEALQFILLDHYHYAGEYNKAIDALELMATHMGIRDSVNWALTAIYYNLMGDNDNAIAAGNQSIELEPDTDFAYLALLTVYNDTKRFDDTVTIMKALEDGFDYEFTTETIGEAPEFQELLDSKAFQDWMVAK